MTTTNKTDSRNSERIQYKKRIVPLVRQAPWVLRVTELKGKAAPVFVIKMRHFPETNGTVDKDATPARPVLRDQGLIYGESLRRCLPVIRHIVGQVRDEADIPLELQQYIPSGRTAFRGNLPLDAEAGTKLALIFKLQARVQHMDRVELIAWRVQRFTREEAEYWRTRCTQFGRAGNRWAVAGMRVMLGGQPGDPHISSLLERYRR